MISPREIAAANSGLFRPGFAEWVAKNQHIVDKFSEVSVRLKNAGRKYYAAGAILYFIRISTDLAEEKPAPFKINQNHSRDIAVLHVLMYPEFSGFFRFKKCDRDEEIDV